MEIFLHQRATPTDLVKVDSGRKVGVLANECLEGAFVWLEDGKEPLDPEKTLEEVGVPEGGHIHIACCKAVVVKVRYAGKDPIEGYFSPASTGSVILKWAASPEGFKLTDSESAKHLLAVCGADIELDQAEHIGFFADEDCAVCLDLIPKDRFAG